MIFCAYSEVGFMVRKIEPSVLRFERVGGPAQVLCPVRL